MKRKKKFSKADVKDMNPPDLTRSRTRKTAGQVPAFPDISFTGILQPEPEEENSAYLKGEKSEITQRKYRIMNMTKGVSG